MEAESVCLSMVVMGAGERESHSQKSGPRKPKFRTLKTSRRGTTPDPKSLNCSKFRSGGRGYSFGLTNSWNVKRRCIALFRLRKNIYNLEKSILE